MGRHGHDRTRAVFHQHVVRHPHRQTLASRGMDRLSPGEDPGLDPVRSLPLERGPARRHPDVLLHLAPPLGAGQLPDQRVLGGQHQVGHAPQRVRPRGERRDPVPPTLHLEPDLHTLTAADPPSLGVSRDLGPVDPLQVVEQPLGVRGDAGKPLEHGALLHLGPAALARAPGRLLVRQDRPAVRAPVHRRLLPVHQPGLEQLQEDPLGPPVVGRVRAVHLVVPVHAGAHALHLLPEAGDVGRDLLPRVPAGLDGVVLRVHAKGIEAEGLEHVKASGTHEAAVDVASHKGEEVAHVQARRRRVGEHHQVVVGFQRALQVDGEGLILAPAPDPLVFYGSVIVFAHRSLLWWWGKTRSPLPGRDSVAGRRRVSWLVVLR